MTKTKTLSARIPEGLHARIATKAHNERRSVTDVIVEVLEAGVPTLPRDRRIGVRAIVAGAYGRRARRIAQACGYEVAATVYPGSTSALERTRGLSVGVLLFDEKLPLHQRNYLQSALMPTLIQEPRMTVTVRDFR